MDPSVNYQGEQDIRGTPYYIGPVVTKQLQEISGRVHSLRARGRLSSEVLVRIQQLFRLKAVYHSNAIEGNQLNLNETKLVISEGLTISGKSLRDQTEAINLSHALDFLEELVKDSERPINETVIRQIHKSILSGIDDDLAGAYRKIDVVITGSKNAPANPESIPAEMGKLNNWLLTIPSPEEEPETHPILIAAALHCWFVMIHPFVDGNGRTARILLNLILMRLGYPVIVIPVDERERYYDALAESDEGDLTHFVQLVIEGIEDSLEQYELARSEESAMRRRITALAEQVSEPFEQERRVEEEKEYTVWKQAMALFKSLVNQAIEPFNSTATTGIQLFYKDYGELDFDKYRLLKTRNSASKTWFFRIDYARGEDRARYVFFFGYPGPSLRARNVSVVLLAAREWPVGSFYYERISEISRNLRIGIAETGYDPEREKMLVVGPGGQGVHSTSMNELAITIFENIVNSGAHPKQA